MQEQDNRVASLGRTLLCIFAGAVPLWFVPWQISTDFGREITFLLLILGAFITWLLSGLLTGRFRLVRSISLYAGAIFMLAASVSTLVSKRPFASAFLSDPSAEKWSTLLAGFLLMIVAANLLSSRRDVTHALVIFLVAAGAEAAMTFFSLVFHLSLFRMIAPFIQGDDFNVIGTFNGAALLYAASFVIGLGFMFAPAFHGLRAWTRWAISTAVVFFLANLVVVHFRAAWIVLSVASLIFSGFMFWMSQRDSQNARVHQGLGWKYGLSLLVLAFSMVMIMMSSPLVGQVGLPTEVSPAAMTTLHIARSVYREGTVRALFGSGPATFDRDWALYKDPAINATPFWSTQFNQGYSWITTVAATMGIVGVLSFILFLAALALVSLRSLLTRPVRTDPYPGGRHDDSGFMVSAFLGFVSMVCVAALYPANLGFVLLLFFFAGLLMTGLSAPMPDDGVRSGLWSISERWFEFQAPWAVFVSSLAVVLLLSLSVGTAYYEVTRIQSVFAQASGIAALNKGDIDGSIRAFERALGYEDKNVRLYQALVQLRTEKIRGLIAAASQGKNVQSDFQQTLQAAVQNSQSSLALSPEDPMLWQAQGVLYELIIPYVPGADRLAFASYQKEIAYDPLNPGPRINLGRTGLLSSDSIQLAINQAQAQNRDQLSQARSQTLDGVEKILREAVLIKPDLAATHFLLAQTALRAGNISKAIQSTEQAKLAAPLDIGIAFQLGLLYYQNNNLDLAAGEFERAVSLNQQYSNARYFLGLVYSRTNNTNGAIAQFEEIAKYNPDNQEIKRILDNLHMGKPALNGIAPPATPPEQRNQPPVAENQQSAPSLNPPTPSGVVAPARSVGAAPRARGRR